MRALLAPTWDYEAARIAVKVVRDASALRVFTACKPVSDAARGGEPAAIKMLSNRAAALERAGAGGPPPNSWALNDAKVPSSPKVELWLRSEQVSASFPLLGLQPQGKPGIAAARLEAGRINSLLSRQGVVAGACGQGKGALVTVTKRQAFFDAINALHASRASELAALRSNLAAAVPGQPPHTHR